jgi:hypothetical protein
LLEKKHPLVLHYGHSRNLNITKTWYHDMFCEI